MLKCNECGRRFEDPMMFNGETEEFWGRPSTEKYEGCPYCKSDDFIDEDEEEEDNDEYGNAL